MNLPRRNNLTLLCLFLALTLQWLSVAAQGKPTSSPVNRAANTLYLPPDSSSFMSLFRKMDGLGGTEISTIRVAHIGGSHVQGGIWSNTFVSSLQSKFNTAGGGYFVFPYRLAKSNTPPYTASFSNGGWTYCRSVGKTFCQPLGVCALNVSTADSFVYFGAKLTRQAACKFVNEISVYHNFNPAFRLDLASTNNTVLRAENESGGFTKFTFDMPVDSVCFQVTRLDTAKGSFILFGLSFENTLTSGFYLAGLGANGASSSSFLRADRFTQQLATLQPDLVIVSLGVNDTQSSSFEKEDFIENYDSLITEIRHANPGAAIMLTTTSDNYIRRKNSNKRTIKAKEAMFELQKRQQVAIWDLFTVMGGYRSITRWQKAGLASRDRVHFTPRGYVLVADLMYEAFMKSYEVYKKNPQ